MSFISLYLIYLIIYIYNFILGVSKNVMAVGFQEEGRWMYTGGEDGKYKFICRDALPLTKDNIKVG